jgi:hypothetical protein
MIPVNVLTTVNRNVATAATVENPRHVAQDSDAMRITSMPSSSIHRYLHGNSRFAEKDPWPRGS